GNLTSLPYAAGNPQVEPGWAEPQRNRRSPKAAAPSYPERGLLPGAAPSYSEPSLPQGATPSYSEPSLPQGATPSCPRESSCPGSSLPGRSSIPGGTAEVGPARGPAGT